MPIRKHHVTSSWIASKLNVNPEEVSLYIQSHFKEYLSQSKEKRMSLADSVQFHTKYLGIIRFGPRDIITSRRTIEDCGYESQSFKNYCAKVLAHSPSSS